MDIHVLGSGSSGNCYRVSDGRTPILLECGLRFAEIRQGLDFRLAELGGCLITHEHGDHARSVRQMIKAGVDCYASAGTWAALDVESHRSHDVDPGKNSRMGTWLVTPFPAHHDAAEPLGFCLDSVATRERLVYSGDTGYIGPRFAGMTHIMVECNNAWDAVRGSQAPAAVKRRVVGTHMSIESVRAFLAANDLSAVREIWLVHLSDQHSDAEDFRRQVQEQTGKATFIAGGIDA